MLAKMIDKIVALKQTQIFDIDGEHYTDGNMTRVPPHVDRPRSINMSGLDSICKLIRTEQEKIGTTIMVQVSSYKQVDVMTTYLPDYSRNALYSAVADAPGIRTGWRSQEEALIELRSLFVPNTGTEYLLDLLSHMSDNSTVTSKDNGVTQQVEARGEEKARAELDRVKRELAELREKPVEVAVEVKDAAPEQLARAREEARKAAEQAWRDKLAAAEKKLSDASAEKKALEDRVAKLQKAAKSGAALSGEVERLKKELALANTGLATFKAKLEGMNAAFSGVNQALSALEADVRPKMVAALRAQFAAWEKELEEKKQC